jgi:hypothetical protein
MKINLLRDYCGRIINDRTLLKGVQDVEDTVGAYLVGKGYAVELATEPLPLAVGAIDEFDLPLTADDFETEEPVITTYADITRKIEAQVEADSRPKPKSKR